MNILLKTAFRRSVPFAMIVVAATAVPSLAAAPQAELWPRWETHAADSSVSIDHHAWGEFLDRHLITDHPSGVARIAYDAVPPADLTRLERYIDDLSTVPVSNLNRPEQFAFWVNLYNAVTVRLILDHLPLESIRDIDRPWDTPLVTVEGVPVTLNDIEHRILRPIWRDPRIHYVVNCASIGCPNLQPEPLTAENAEEVMERAAVAYVNHPRGVWFQDGRLQISSIYRWFREDFGDDEDAVLAHLAEYASPTMRAQLREYDRRIRYAYDWSLNTP